MTDEFEAENPHVPEAPEPEDVPVYVWAVVMLESGEIKLVTELPFKAKRKAIMSDVSMTAQFIVDSIKSGAVS